MRMYELWKLPKQGGEPMRLEDAGGPILFQRVCEAEAYSQSEPDFREAEFRVMATQVGLA